jgi:hypothetical protein
MARWFNDVFGLEEVPADIQQNFKLEGDDLVVGARRFHVGVFETPSVSALRRRLAHLQPTKGVLQFEQIVGNVVDIHRDRFFANSVIQAASQFNCLEMRDPTITPDDGITMYAYDNTQGPKCAMVCPAAALFRNYFAMNGKPQTAKNQINTLDGVEALLEEKYWTMTNGYCMPSNLEGLNARLPELSQQVASALKVGVHWDTEVHGAEHRVCQVYSAAMPVAYSRLNKETWAPIAKLVLLATYEAIFNVAAIVSALRKQRAKLVLTLVGGGAFGNEPRWIAEAIRRSLAKFREFPLDVYLLHYNKDSLAQYSDMF